MAEPIDDGGPAFPQELVTGFDARSGAIGISIKSEYIRGMSLRDYLRGASIDQRVRCRLHGSRNEQRGSRGVHPAARQSGVLAG